jgi:hypothetical protein
MAPSPTGPLKEANEMKLSEAAQKVIALGGKVRAYYERELPKCYSSYPIMKPGEKGPPPPKEETELRQFLISLPPDIIYRLVLLMRLGYEAFGADQLAEQYKVVKETFLDGPEWAVSQMMGRSTLANYLSDGLAELKRHRIHVDALPVGDSEKATA